MKQTINASVVNMGSGNIEVNNSNIVSGQNNTITLSDDIEEQIIDIINQIDILTKGIDHDRSDISEAITEIQDELKNTIHRPTIIKKALNLIKGIVGVGEVYELAQKAITLLAI